MNGWKWDYKSNQTCRSRTCFCRGFTLVELVITLVLIGILSALGIGLLASPSTYSAGAARDQFVSTALLAQKHALAGGPSNSVNFSYEQIGSELIFRVARDGDELAVRSADASDLDFSPADFSVDFDSQGHLSGGSEIPVNFEAGSSEQACISELGFAYAGGCR